MSKHPVNLAIRFALEVVAIISFAIWGLKLLDSWVSIILAILLPLIFALLWGVFAVPGDPDLGFCMAMPRKHFDWCSTFSG